MLLYLVIVLFLFRLGYLFGPSFGLLSRLHSYSVCSWFLLVTAFALGFASQQCLNLKKHNICDCLRSFLTFASQLAS